MKLNRNRILSSLIVLFTLFGCKEKYGYIDLNTVYTEFTLSKKLEKERDLVVNSRQGILDSLKLQLNQLSKQFQFKVDSNQIQFFNQKREEYYYKEQQFIEDNQSLLMKHDEQIMKQLNVYIKDYGKEKGYKFIFGATGNGTLMYAEEDANISKDVLSYVNEKYEGLK
jgi:outer membrane protein